MTYLALIYSDGAVWTSASPAGQEQQIREMLAFSQAAFEAGTVKNMGQLHPASAATTVRHRDGKRTLTDGPFAETKEVLGGYYLLDVPDLDAAIAFADACPAVKFGASIEVRPLVEH